MLGGVIPGVVWSYHYKYVYYFYPQFLYSPATQSVLRDHPYGELVVYKEVWGGGAGWWGGRVARLGVCMPPPVFLAF